MSHRQHLDLYISSQKCKGLYNQQSLHHTTKFAVSQAGKERTINKDRKRAIPVFVHGTFKDDNSAPHKILGPGRILRLTSQNQTVNYSSAKETEKLTIVDCMDVSSSQISAQSLKTEY